MQITGNSLKLPSQGNGDELLLDTAPSGVVFDGIRLNVSIPITITGTPTPVAADLKEICRKTFGNFTLEEGPKLARSVVHAALDGNDLRTMSRFAQRDELINNFVGVAQAAGATTFTFTVFVPFCAPSFYRSANRRRPGTTQVRTMKVRAVEGGTTTWTTTAGIARAAGNIIVEVEYVGSIGPDQWAPILSMQREQSPRRDVQGPDGLTLLAYVPDQAASASPLTAFTVQVGHTKVTDLQTVQNLAHRYLDLMQVSGGTTITDEHTPLHFVEAGVDLDEAPHGKVQMVEAKSDLNPWNVRFLYLPPRDALRAKAEAKQTADAYQAPVKLSQPAVSEDADWGAPSTQAVRVFVRGDARFTLKPGLFATNASDAVSVDIPAQYRGQAKAAAQQVAGSGAVVQNDASRRVVKVVSLMVPGSTDSAGNRQGDVADAVSRAFAA